MARDHARIKVSIWSDPEFRALPVAAQHFYMLAASQPRLTYCGVLDYMPSRLAQFAADLTPRAIGKAVETLAAERFVVVDYDTHELLLRSFVRHDGLLQSPNVTKAMAKDYAAILSPHIQHAVTQELCRAYRESPGLKGWEGLQQSLPALHSMVSAKGSRKGSANG